MTQAERKERTRAQIEAAGIKCFSKKPFDAVTMEEIAAQAQYTKRTVYNYFPTKTSLLASIFENKLEALYSIELHTLEKCTSARDVIYVHAMELSKFTENNLNFMHMFWSLKDNISNSEVPEETLTHIISINRKLIDTPVRYLKKFELTGFLANSTPEVIIHYISAVNKGLVLQCDKENALCLNGPGKDLLTNFALDSLLHGL